MLDGAVHIEAVLQLSQLGQEGGHAVADVLLGKTTPEGKLTATWARRYTDYPCARVSATWTATWKRPLYREGIYVGYRYFDSFGVQPLFPFGYGLSYTDFSLRFAGLRVERTPSKWMWKWKNAGICFSGREVAQVYISCPQNGGAKELRRLAGVCQDPAPRPRTAPDPDHSAFPKNSWPLLPRKSRAGWWRQGLYGVWVGNSSAAVTLCAQIRVDADTVIEQTHPICPCTSRWTSWAPRTPPKKRQPTPRGCRSTGFCPRPEPRPECPPAPLAEGPVEELIPLLYGNITKGTSTLGSAGVRVARVGGREHRGAGGQPRRALSHHGRRPCRAAPAPELPGGPGLRPGLRRGGAGLAGKRLSGDPVRSTTTPILLPVSARRSRWGRPWPRTWDTALMEEFGRAVAREMEEVWGRPVAGPGHEHPAQPVVRAQL